VCALAPLRTFYSGFSQVKKEVVMSKPLDLLHVKNHPKDPYTLWIKTTNSFGRRIYQKGMSIGKSTLDLGQSIDGKCALIYTKEELQSEALVLLTINVDSNSTKTFILEIIDKDEKAVMVNKFWSTDDPTRLLQFTDTSVEVVVLHQKTKDEMGRFSTGRQGEKQTVNGNKLMQFFTKKITLQQLVETTEQYSREQELEKQLAEAQEKLAEIESEVSKTPFSTVHKLIQAYLTLKTEKEEADSFGANWKHKALHLKKDITLAVQGGIGMKKRVAKVLADSIPKYNYDENGDLIEN
jgi:hypothetical protein